MAQPANVADCDEEAAAMTSTEIQTIAALIQAAAAVVFLVSVLYDASRRHWLREQERRDTLIKALQIEFIARTGSTPEEAAGFISPRQTEFINARLNEMGVPWTYPFPRVEWW
jgi:hypothetical protein